MIPSISARTVPIQSAPEGLMSSAVIIAVTIAIAQTHINHRRDCHFVLFISSLECNVYAVSISFRVVQDSRYASDLRAVPADMPVGGRRDHVVAEMELAE